MERDLELNKLEKKSDASTKQNVELPTLDIDLFYEEIKYVSIPYVKSMVLGIFGRPIDPAEMEKIVQNFMRFFLYGSNTLSGMGDLSWFTHPRFWSALIRKKDPELLAAWGKELESIFSKLSKQLTNLPPQKQKECAIHIDLLVNHFKSIYVFTEPTPNRPVKLPVKNIRTSLWEEKECLIERRKQTNHPSLEHILKPEDHIYFDIIIPQDKYDEKDYPVTFVFMGTGVPTSQGIAMQNIGNSLPDKEIGQYTFEADAYGEDIARKEAQKYTEQGIQVDLTGASRGARDAINYGMYFTSCGIRNIRVIALVPALFHELPTKDHALFGGYFLLDPKDRPPMLLFIQSSCPVSNAFYILTGENITLVKSGGFAHNPKAHPSIEDLIASLDVALPILEKYKLVGLLFARLGGKIKGLFGFESPPQLTTFSHAFLSHIVIETAQKGLSLTHVKSIEAENNLPTRKQLTEIAKNTVLPYIYSDTVEKAPHLAQEKLPLLMPQPGCWTYTKQQQQLAGGKVSETTFPQGDDWVEDTSRFDM